MPLLLLALLGVLLLVPEKKAPAGPPRIVPPIKTRTEFVAQFTRDASRVDMRKIPVNAALAVAATETGWGGVTVPADIFWHTWNYFSIKATANWRGKAYKGHRAYPDGVAALENWLVLITQSKRYARAYALLQAGQVKPAFAELQRAGYAGDENDPAQGKDYAVKLAQNFDAIGRA